MSLTDEQIAQVVHEAMSAYRAATGQDALPAWAEAEGWMRESTAAAVKFRRENPGAPDSAQHDQWAEEKRANGWTYAAVRDNDKKHHPMLIPYADLPEVERRKDALVGAVIDALMADVS